MGSAMASNLQNYLHAQGQQPLRFWNRTASKGEILTSLGGIQCDSITDVVRDSTIIFLSVGTSHSSCAKFLISELD
jgi:3-hydroxyisobutyrate dehydrogenase-like beta-hydroxyacid dehydrogenase